MKFATSKKRLQVAIDAYRAKAGDDLDQHGHKVLDRLAADERAADAFAKFNVDDAAAASILTACIEGDLLRRTFPDRISAEQAMLARLEQLDKAIADLRTFVAELSQGPSDRLAAFVIYHADDMAAMRRGLYLHLHIWLWPDTHLRTSQPQAARSPETRTKDAYYCGIAKSIFQQPPARRSPPCAARPCPLCASTR